MKIAVGMSGGVDSAVAALLLQRRGYDVFGLFMKNWEEDDDESYCAAAEDLEYAEAVCKQLSIPLHTVNFAAEYWDRVFQSFLRDYRRGRTPNPDVLCNREIKFKVFAEHARGLSCDKIATGHYAGIRYTDGEWHLLKGGDTDKDQSYFLHLLQQVHLAQTLFPLAEIRKSKVRELARQAGLVSCDRKDSTGICFIGERRFRDFLARYLDLSPGEIVDESGVPIGTHQGVWFHTIGQRAGLGIGGVRGGSKEAWYVAAKDVAHNRIVAVQGDRHPALFSSALVAESVHWINAPPEDAAPLKARIRHRQTDQDCHIHSQDDLVRVQFERPQRAVTPGQSVVFYHGENCLGGGVIASALPE